MNFLGTTDAAPLNIRVNNVRALRIEPATYSPNLIGGSAYNSATAGVYAATIAGGGVGSNPNKVSDSFGTVGGGRGNVAGDEAGDVENAQFATVAGGGNNKAVGLRATVGGGWANVAGSTNSTVGGGHFNVASGTSTTIGGGFDNAADANDATVAGGEGNAAGGLGAAIGGGYYNVASGFSPAIPGGYANVAAGDYSFAAGRRAKISANADGSFAFADGNDVDFNVVSSNTFQARAVNGFYFYTNTAQSQGVRILPGAGAWTSISDRNAKTNFTPVDAEEVLKKVAEMPLSTWNYKTEDEAIRHMGPMAQDFHAAFGLAGADDKGITTIDADGVALAAIQGLYRELQKKGTQLAEMETRLSEREAQLHAVQATQDELVQALRVQNRLLETRLESLEERQNGLKTVSY